MKLIDLFTINNNKSLFQNLSFWSTLLIPTLIGLILGLFVWSEFTFSLTPQGYETFLKISALPLACMGLSFPLIAIYMYHYKSKQEVENTYLLQEKEIVNHFDLKLNNINNLLLTLKMIHKRLGAMEYLRKNNVEPIESIIDSIILIYIDWIELLKNSLYISIISSEQEIVEHIESKLLAFRLIANSPKKLLWSGDLIDTSILLNILIHKITIKFYTVHNERYQELAQVRKSFGFESPEVHHIESSNNDKITHYLKDIDELNKSIKSS